MSKFIEPSGPIDYRGAGGEKSLQEQRMHTKDTCESMFAKWMQRRFVEFKDGDENNLTPDNFIPRTLEYCVKNYKSNLIITNLTWDLDEKELALLDIEGFRDAIYYAKQT